MATVESFRKLLKPLMLASKVIGTEIWTAPGKCLPAAWNLSFHVIVYFVSTGYTLYKYRDDPLYMMKVLITLGTAVQLYIKFFVTLYKSSEIKLFTAQIERNILEPYQCGSEDEMAILVRTGRYLWVTFRLMCFSVIGTAVTFPLYPFFVYYMSGQVLPLFLYELPYYDWRSTWGYVVNMLFQVNLLAIGVFGLILSDFMVFMYSMYSLAMVDICIIHLRELEAMLNDRVMVDKRTAEIQQKWMQCMRDHQQSVSLLNSIEDMYGIMCLVQVIMGVFTLCNGMLLVVLTDWYPTYGFLLVMFTEITIYFIIGHIIEVKIDDLYNTITSMPWYKLPVMNQNEFRFLLCRQQRPMVLTAYGFMPMNFETYMSVLRLLYQFFVMIMQYVG